MDLRRQSLRKDVVDAMQKMLEMPQEERQKLGEAGRQHVLKNYNFETFEKTWVDWVSEIMKESGSWSDRKNYQNWTLKELS